MSSTGRSTRTRESTSTDTTGLGTTRARIVGARTGVLADSIVAVVRGARAVGRGFARVGRRLSGVITPLGWVVLLVIPAALAAGYLLGWLEFVAVGWGALLLALAASCFLIGRAPYRMTLTLPHRRAVVGESARGAITVDNPAGRRLGTVLEVPVGESVVELALPGMRRRTSHTQDFAIPTERRGVIAVGPVRTVVGDPLGLIRREHSWTDRLELVVHPRTVSVPSTSTGLIRDLEGTPTRDLTASDVAFHALREYQSGDDRRYIHWKSTAKTGTYMVRQFEQTRRSHLVVALSLSTHDFASEDEFELAVSVAGSLGVRAIRDGRTVSVVVSAVTPEFAKRRVYAVHPLATHQPDRLLDELAVVGASIDALPIRDVARIVADGTPGISVAFLICGSRTGTAELRAAAAGFAQDVEVVAVVCDPDAVPGMRRLAGLNVLTIGYLDELRLALARSAAVA
ncbi:DUF58 domain-containing protein [Protaetiibacter sp. SSC-01]|uniref:DUF58 domain-containing protein n=1 Tax=Protaetiibacter sp. SSC-01 TaxID=2759943 RepID=UPI001657134F|nr:DUF58 domain-containing protein [Protaetiibacter sp. SSC-01]QNO38542.1 DUF58 domain-containing protein [Protaetiibacter sp. SSC-01]